MSNALKLKQFCDTNGFEIPEFKITQANSIEYIEIYWYSEKILETKTTSSKDYTLSKVIKDISDWLESEYNFMFLLHLQKNCMR